MSSFLRLEDLDEGRQPRIAWLKGRNLEGILFMEVPGQEGFETLVGRLGPNFDDITVVHAEFARPLQEKAFRDPAAAYRFVFSIIYEDIFLFINYVDHFYLIWMPQDHKFFALFGHPRRLRAEFSKDLASLREQFAEYIAARIFNDRAKSYLNKATEDYFTLRIDA